MRTPQPGLLRQMPQLDGLRALAAFSVLWFHWIPVGRYVLGTSLGEGGVWLFFVLSGFLISGILFDCRERAGADLSRTFILRHFYARRALRIFPLFYLILALALLLNVGSFRDKWLWHASYLSNVYFTTHADGAGSHLWSLAVEEQFYLCWPALILFAPRRLILPAILLLLGVAPFFRLAAWRQLLWDTAFTTNFLTPGVLDCLAVGALLAYAVRNPSSLEPGRLSRAFLGIGVVGYAVLHIAGFLAEWKQTFLALCFGWLVWRASVGFTGRVGRLLEWGPIAYLGKISYGIYVIHGFALFIWYWLLYEAPIPGYRIFLRMHVPPEVYGHEAFRVAAMALITFTLAPLSWHLYESPLNNLKRYFPYTASGR